MTIKRTLFSLAATMTLVAAWAAIPAGYYSGLEGKKKADLKEAAKQAARKHTAISYGDATWEVFEQTDTRTIGGALCWWDMYSDQNVKVSNGHPGMNIEHSVANSWWGGTKNDAYKDLFHLNPSDATANNRKSNYPLGIVETVSWTNGVTTVGKPASGTCFGASNVYEPADEYKGDFARAFFYMFTIYDDISWMADASDRNYMFDGSQWPSLRPWAYEMLLDWARQDPVSEKEAARNEAIYAIQKNRNPFIDYPDLAEYVWGGKTADAFSLSADHGSVSPDPIDPVDPVDPIDPVDPVNPPALNGEWTLVTSGSELDSESSYIVVASKDLFGMGCTLINNKALSKTEDKLEVAAGKVSSIPSDIAIVKLEPSAGSWLMRLADTEGNTLGYLNSTVAKTMTLVEADATPVEIEPGFETTTISFGEGRSLQYNPSSPRFCTYAGTQQDVQLYRQKTGGTSVGQAIATEAEELVFDLMGRRVDPRNLRPGIYIRAGRKVLVH